MQENSLSHTWLDRLMQPMLKSKLLHGRTFPLVITIAGLLVLRALEVQEQYPVKMDGILMPVAIDIGVNRQMNTISWSLKSNRVGGPTNQ